MIWTENRYLVFSEVFANLLSTIHIYKEENIQSPSVQFRALLCSSVENPEDLTEYCFVKIFCKYRQVEESLLTDWKSDLILFLVSPSEASRCCLELFAEWKVINSSLQRKTLKEKTNNRRLAKRYFV